MVVSIGFAPANAKAQGRTYLGPTFLSHLVVYKAQDVYSNLSALLTDDSMDDNPIFGAIWFLTSFRCLSAAGSCIDRWGCLGFDLRLGISFHGTLQ